MTGNDLISKYNNIFIEKIKTTEICNQKSSVVYFRKYKNINEDQIKNDKKIFIIILKGKYKKKEREIYESEIQNY